MMQPWWIKIVIALVVVFIFSKVLIDQYDTVSNDCKPNGKQRLVNTVDGVAVQDQLVCKGGRTKWTLN